MENFKGYTIYGPYLGQAEQRRIVTLVSPEHRTTMSYARYLMCKHEDRWLDKEEVVDHIDNNQLNDVIENLQILTHTQNVQKSAKPVQYLELVCGFCEKEFVRERRHVVHTKRKLPICCSRSCSAKLQKSLE